VWRCERLSLRGSRRSRGRKKKYWGDVIIQDMTQLHIIMDMTLGVEVACLGRNLVGSGVSTCF